MGSYGDRGNHVSCETCVGIGTVTLATIVYHQSVSICVICGFFSGCYRRRIFASYDGCLRNISF